MVIRSIKILLATFALTVFHGYSKQVSIIPEPSKITYQSGYTALTKDVRIFSKDDLSNEVLYLADILKKGFGDESNHENPECEIHLKIETCLQKTLGNEGYLLSTLDKKITIEAATPTGIFYGIQSFRQLLPVEFEYANLQDTILIPRVEIIDSPRFPWRAFMLDESRHFKGVENVKKLLNQMAILKLNTFHWHLTDDQGWRIEIKKYPKLTEVGSKRKNTQTSRRSEERTGKPHEGFYSQIQIKEIIKYAQDLHITIVPEIEMPGHAMAAVAAYPWLGSLGTTREVSVTFGKMDDSFNVSNPKVIQFLKDVLDEVMALFPGKIIHIGGDEVNLKTWENSETVQNFMKSENLKSPIDLQIYFTNLISKYIEDNGKRMMGWNEIMGGDIHGENEEMSKKTEQKLAKSAIIHFWKGNLDLINKAVEEGYNVVNSNHWDTYLDYTYERLPLSKSYDFNPIPEGLDKQYSSLILGLGTQMWSEWIPTVELMENQIFPRLAAYSEVGWTELKNKNYDRFIKSLESLKTRWSFEHISFNKASE